MLGVILAAGHRLAPLANVGSAVKIRASLFMAKQPTVLCEETKETGA
jgi:hypothetical protein